MIAIDAVHLPGTYQFTGGGLVDLDQAYARFTCRYQRYQVPVIRIVNNIYQGFADINSFGYCACDRVDKKQFIVSSLQEVELIHRVKEMGAEKDTFAQVKFLVKNYLPCLQVCSKKVCMIDRQCGAIGTVRVINVCSVVFKAATEGGKTVSQLPDT